jgi:PAS domain S-box-containing protein
LEVYAQREIAERALSGAFAGNSWHGELALLRKDGTTVPIEGTADPIFDDAGELIGIIGVHRDISERIESERRLRESEERFRAAFENAVVGKGLVLPSAEILRVNDSLAITLGMTREELEHTTWMEYIDPEYISVVHQKVQDLLNGEYPSAHMEMKLIRKDGNRIWARVFGVVVHDPDGRPLYIVADVEDISHLKDYEDQLRKYEQIVSASKDLMSLVSRDFVYEAVNDKYLEYYALSREEIIGRTVWEIMGQQSFATQINSRLEQAFSGEPSNYQDHFDYAGCGRRYMDVSYFPLFGAEGKVEGVVVNARDITETKKLEEQLLQSQKIESIGTLAGGVAHEINNPINGIMNYAQLIADRLGDESPEAELADEIIRETKRVATIVQNLLTFARHEKQSHSPAYLSDIVSAVLSLIQTVMRHDQIDLQVNIADGLPKLKCRSQEIQQVLMNLMTNARDALNERYPEYSPEKKLRLSARLIKKGGKSYIRTTVEDTGPGIPLEIRERIFDPFFTNKPKEKGTGLGLSISYGIVKSHHGKLLVESELGQYTRFHMDLPVDNGWKLE